MKVLGIDPGTTQSAYVLWDGGHVIEADIIANHTMLMVLNLMRGVADLCVIEKIASFGMAVGAEVFETVYWTGRFAQCWHVEGVVRIPRLEIKIHLCKSARAKDANVSQALKDRFGQVGTKKNPGPLFGISSHKWAALAVAVCAWDRSNIIT